MPFTCLGKREGWGRGRAGEEGGLGKREGWGRGRAGEEGVLGKREGWGRGYSCVMSRGVGRRSLLGGRWL